MKNAIVKHNKPSILARLKCDAFARMCNHESASRKTVKGSEQYGAEKYCQKSFDNILDVIENCLDQNLSHVIVRDYCENMMRIVDEDTLQNNVLLAFMADDIAGIREPLERDNRLNDKARTVYLEFIQFIDMTANYGKYSDSTESSETIEPVETIEPAEPQNIVKAPQPAYGEIVSLAELAQALNGKPKNEKHLVNDYHTKPAKTAKKKRYLKKPIQLQLIA